MNMFSLSRWQNKEACLFLRLHEEKIDTFISLIFFMSDI